MSWMISCSLSPPAYRVHTRRASLIAASFDRRSLSPSTVWRARNWRVASIWSGGGSACDAEDTWETPVDPLDRNRPGSWSKITTAAIAPTTNTTAASMARAGSGVGFGEGVVISLRQEYFLVIPVVNVPAVYLL